MKQRKNFLLVPNPTGIGSFLLRALYHNDASCVLPFYMEEKQEAFLMNNQFEERWFEYFEPSPKAVRVLSHYGESVLVIDTTGAYTDYLVKYDLPSISLITAKDAQPKPKPISRNSRPKVPVVIKPLVNALFLPNPSIHGIVFEEFIRQMHVDLSSSDYGFIVISSSEKSFPPQAVMQMVDLFQSSFALKAVGIDLLDDPKDQIANGIPNGFLGRHLFTSYHLVSDKSSDPILLQLYEDAKSFFGKNSIFTEFVSSSIDRGKTEKIVTWRNDLATIVFSIRYVEADGQTSIIFSDNILGQHAYVNGLLQYAIPFMQEQIKKGLTGKNFDSHDVYQLL